MKIDQKNENLNHKRRIMIMMKLDFIDYGILKGIELSNNSDSNTVLENVKTIIKDSNVKRPD